MLVADDAAVFVKTAEDHIVSVYKLKNSTQNDGLVINGGTSGRSFSIPCKW